MCSPAGITSHANPSSCTPHQPTTDLGCLGRLPWQAARTATPSGGTVLPARGRPSGRGQGRRLKSSKSFYRLAVAGAHGGSCQSSQQAAVGGSRLGLGPDAAGCEVPEGSCLGELRGQCHCVGAPAHGQALGLPGLGLGIWVCDHCQSWQAGSRVWGPDIDRANRADRAWRAVSVRPP